METQIASFVLTTDLKQMLKQWAAASDRTVSAELRQILQAEADRRQRQQAKPGKQQ